MSRFVRIVFLASLAIVGACGVLDVETVDIDSSGVVRFVDVEGGCWVIDAADSTRYEPINLQEGARVDGLVVLFRANRRRDVATICEVGEIIELKSLTTPPD